MKAYKKYKDTEISWLRRVPEHWTKIRYKDILKYKDEKVGLRTNLTLLSLTKKGVIIRDLSEGKGKFPKDFESYKVVYPNDLILCLFDVDETPRTVGLARNYGMITGAYDVFDVVNCNREYIYNLYLSFDEKKTLKPLYKGLRKTIPLPSLLSSYVYLPPKAEQDAIVAYINKKVTEIDRFVIAKEKQLSFLDELKQKIIADAVTGKCPEAMGRKRSPGYQETKVSLIPKIPEHWKVNTLRKHVSLVSEKNHPEATLLSVTREQGVIVRNTESKEENHNFIPDDLSGYKYVKRGQFVINKMKSWQGSYGVSDYDGIVSPAYFVCDLRFENKRFFSIAIRSKAYIPFFTQFSKGIRIDQWDLDPDALKSIPFFCPPKEEQDSIVAYIDKKVSQIAKLRSGIEAQIKLLKEYKQTIISDAVTGKVCVTGV